MLEKIGCPIVSAKRTKYATVKLSKLRRGEWRELSKGEVTKLKASCKKSESTITTKDNKSHKEHNKGIGYSSNIANNRGNDYKRRNNQTKQYQK